MTGEKRFKVDNTVLDNVAGHMVARRKGKNGPEQLPLPGIGAMTALELYTLYACFYFAERSGDVNGLVEVSITDFIERLENERYEAGETGYQTFDTQTYKEVYDALFRLYTASREYVYTRKGQTYAIQTRLLTSLGLRFAGVDAVEDQPKHRLINLNAYSEDFPVWSLTGRRPNGLVFQLSPSLTAGILGRGEHIGYSLLPEFIFGFRKTPGGGGRQALLTQFVSRQTGNEVAIHIDNLRDKLAIPGRNVNRDRESILKHLKTLKDLGEIESYSLDRRNILRVKKTAKAAGKDPPPAKA